MEEHPVTYEIESGVAVIKLNRPKVLNSFNRAMAEMMQAHLDSVKQDKSVRSVFLTGEGRAFCAGQDLDAITAPDGKSPGELGEIVTNCYNPIISAIRHTEKPFVCAVNGVAAGAGANLALSCDFVLASNESNFIQAFCKVGLVPDSGGSFFLPRLVGVARATALMMLGDKLSAKEAYENGLIFKVCDKAELLAEAMQLAKHLASQPTAALGLIKRSLNSSLTNDLDCQLKLEAELQATASKTHDHKEGVSAFLEKREPKFIGE